MPFLASALVARMLQEALGPTSTLPGHVLRWAGVILGSTAVLVTADRVTRHLLPIAALFQVAMVFPDRAPSRYKVALRTGSATRLAEQIRRGEALGGTPTSSVKRVLNVPRDW